MFLDYLDSLHIQLLLCVFYQIFSIDFVFIKQCCDFPIWKWYNEENKSPHWNLKYLLVIFFINWFVIWSVKCQKTVKIARNTSWSWTKEAGTMRTRTAWKIEVNMTWLLIIILWIY